MSPKPIGSKLSSSTSQTPVNSRKLQPNVAPVSNGAKALNLPNLCNLLVAQVWKVSRVRGRAGGKFLSYLRSLLHKRSS